MAFSAQRERKVYFGGTRMQTMLKTQTTCVLLVDTCSSWAKNPSHGAVKCNQQLAGQVANLNTAPYAIVLVRQFGFDYLYRSLELTHLSQPLLAWIIRVLSNLQKIQYSTTVPSIFEVDRHFSRQKVESGEILVEYDPTDKQPADMLTKALTKTKFQVARERLRMLTPKQALTDYNRF